MPAQNFVVFAIAAKFHAILRRQRKHNRHQAFEVGQADRSRSRGFHGRQVFGSRRRNQRQGVLAVKARELDAPLGHAEVDEAQQPKLLQRFGKAFPGESAAHLGIILLFGAAVAPDQIGECADAEQGTIFERSHGLEEAAHATGSRAQPPIEQSGHGGGRIAFDDFPALGGKVETALVELNRPGFGREAEQEQCLLLSRDR